MRWALMIALGIGPLGAVRLAAAGEVQADRLAQGRRVYDDARCATCHSIAGAGNPRSPLDGVGGRLSREAMRRWIVAPAEMKPGVRKKPYTLPEADLEALLDYLQSLSKTVAPR